MPLENAARHEKRGQTEVKLINIGFGNMVAASRLIAIVSPDSAPVKRTVQEARDRGMIIDGTYGRRTRGCSSWTATMLAGAHFSPKPSPRASPATHRGSEQQDA